MIETVIKMKSTTCKPNTVGQVHAKIDIDRFEGKSKAGASIIWQRILEGVEADIHIHMDRIYPISQ